MSKLYYSKIDIQNRLNISPATVNNWIKTGIIPFSADGYYSAEEYADIIEHIELQTEKLQSRANRSQKNESNIVYLGINDKNRKELLEYLVKIFELSNLSVIEGLACLGKQILICNNLYHSDSEIYGILNGLHSGCNIFEECVIENKDDDILGAFYQSVQKISNKSKDGSYYTPPKIMSAISIPLNAKVLDPCCGSGSILINALSKNHNPNMVYDFDCIVQKNSVQIYF